MKEIPQVTTNRLLTLISEDWVDRRHIVEILRPMYKHNPVEGSPSVLLAAIAQLTRTGLLHEEVYGGRVKRPRASSKPRQVRVKVPKIRFNLDPEILYWLGEQFDPVPTSCLADSVHMCLEHAIEDLCRLQDEGKVAMVGQNHFGEDLWVLL